MACSKLTKCDLEMLYDRTSVDALNVASLRILSEQLNNSGKLVELADGSGRQVFDDYTGIAEQENFCREEIVELAESADPTKSLVSEMAIKECTVGHLRRDLFNMARMDVIRLSHPNWVYDCRVYEERFKTNCRPIEDLPDLTLEQETKLDDKHRTMYDAFLSYASGDIRLVKRVLQKCEKEMGFSFYVPGRNDIPGGAKHVLSAYVIEKRCRQVIILLTREFRSSPECDFQVRFANALDPGAIDMKIIPVICEKNAEVPRFLKAIKTCDITKNDWQSLYRALSYKTNSPNTRFLESLTYPCSAKLNVKRKSKLEERDSYRYQPEGESRGTQDDKSDTDDDDLRKVIFV